MTSRRQFLAALATTTLTSALWVPSLSTVFGPAEGTLAGDPDDPWIAGLIERQLQIWEGGDWVQSELMRFVNPEWDLMGRTFAGLALLNAVARKPALADRVRPAVDHLLENTLTTLRERGKLFFLMAYGRGTFLNPTGASVFIDGEMLLLAAARESVFQDGRFAAEQAVLAQRVTDNMDASPCGHGESYPNECWAVCNGFAALGLQMDQRTSSRSHRATLERHEAGIPIERKTGMLQSEYTYDGRPMDGPEGSSIYLTAGLLEHVAPGMGRAQYELARTHLARRFLGFGYSREWVEGYDGYEDVDSGPIVPFFQASSAASGLAFIGAKAFEDTEMLEALLASLKATAFPTWEGPALSFAASNPVGDASILYALVQGGLDLGRVA